ncbi:MAG: sensor histidine kinase [Polyangiales bacterium]
MSLNRETHPFVGHVVGQLRARRREITRKWLEVLKERLEVSPIRIFPDASLLNHIPDLLDRILQSVGERNFGDIDGDELVQSEIRKLAELRRVQGYTLEEIVLEFQALRFVMRTELTEASEPYTDPVPPTVALELAHDLEWTLAVLTRGTARAYNEAAQGDRDERSALLSAYGRAIAHELRGRLNNAVLALDVYRQRRRADPHLKDGDELLDRLERALQQLDGVAADVFSAVVSESRLAHTPGRRLPFDQVVRETCEELELFAVQREVEIRMADDYPKFPVDAPRLHVILVNLVTNAIKYSDSSKEERWVRIDALREPEPGSWRVTVADNGIGIGKAFRKSVFQRNIRLAGSSEEPGEGLGLTLAHEAASQLGGALWIDSTLGQGTNFAFTLSEPDAELTVASNEG